jgi:hypothetical protein
MQLVMTSYRGGCMLTLLAWAEQPTASWANGGHVAICDDGICFWPFERKASTWYQFGIYCACVLAVLQAAGYGKVVSHVIIGLKTVKGTKQLKLDPTIYDSLQKERVQVRPAPRDHEPLPS